MTGKCLPSEKWSLQGIWTQTFPPIRKHILNSGLLVKHRVLFEASLWWTWGSTPGEGKTKILTHNCDIFSPDQESPTQRSCLSFKSWAHTKSHIESWSHVGSVEAAAIIGQTDSTNPNGDRVSMHATILPMDDIIAECNIYFALFLKSAAYKMRQVFTFLFILVCMPLPNPMWSNISLVSLVFVMWRRLYCSLLSFTLFLLKHHITWVSS